MDVRNNHASSDARAGLHASYFAAKGAGKALRKGASILSLKVKLLITGALIAIILIAVITTGLSVSQTDRTLHLTASGEERGFFNRPSEEEKERALWDKDYTKENTVKYLEVIADYEAADQETQKQNIGKICAKNGWDVTRSLSNLEITEKTNPASEEGKNSDTLIRSFSLSNISASSLKTFKYERVSKIKDTLNLLKNEGTGRDADGLYRYESGQDEKDYIAAMPANFGANGSRFKVQLSDGSCIRVIKAATLTSLADSPYELKGGGVIRFIADTSKLQKKYISSGNVNRLFNNAYITSIEEIESKFTHGTAVASSIGERMLAAFSIYMDNGQVIKTDTGYVNQDGEKSKANERKTDYMKELKKAINSYLARDGHFYEIDFQRDANDNILVKTYVWYETYTVIDKKTGKEVTKERRHEIDYVYPLLIELDIDQIAEDIFELDPQEMYVNSGGLSELYMERESAAKKEGTRITTSEAINHLLSQTGAILFDRDFTSDAVYLSGLGGQLEWPCPGYFTITSPYGTRLHPITKRYAKHDGVDVAVNMYSPIVAAEAGTVTYAGWLGNYGYYISIDHGDGLITAYAHLDSVGVSKGQKVVRGQQIANSGNTGRSTGPHLHFEVKYNGSTQDPMLLVK